MFNTFHFDWVKLTHYIRACSYNSKHVNTLSHKKTKRHISSAESGVLTLLTCLPLHLLHKAFEVFLSENFSPKGYSSLPLPLSWPLAPFIHYFFFYPLFLSCLPSGESHISQPINGADSFSSGHPIYSTRHPGALRMMYRCPEATQTKAQSHTNMGVENTP